MSKRNLKITPTYELGPYSSKVPFYRHVYVAETILTSNDVLEPFFDKEGGSRLAPQTGATTIYRLIGNGVNVPTFDPQFSPTTGVQYDSTAGIVNVVIFKYDGTDFTYSITKLEPVVNIPSFGIPAFVSDFGLGNVIYINTKYGISFFMSLSVTDTPGWGLRVISAFDILTSVHYTGSETLIYEMSKDGVTWNSSTDPKDAVVVFDCVDLMEAQSEIHIRVTDGVLMSQELILIGPPVTDPYSICGA